MDNSLKQYEINVHPDDVGDALEEIAKTMGIKIDHEMLRKSFQVRDPYSEDHVCIFIDENETRNFILTDCTYGDTLSCILVRCYGEICEKVKSKMLEVDTFYRKMGGQETYDDLENTISDPKSGINFMIKIYKNLKIPGVNS